MNTDSRRQRPARNADRPALTTSATAPLAALIAFLALDFIILLVDWFGVVHLPDAAWVALVIAFPLLTSWTVFYAWAGRSWRLYMPSRDPQQKTCDQRDIMRSQRKAARRISHQWGKLCPQIFSPKKCNGIYQLPGIKRMRFSNSDLLVDLAFPIARYSGGELDGGDTLNAFRDSFGLHDVVCEGREGNIVTYRITAMDTMRETHYAKIDD